MMACLKCSGRCVRNGKSKTGIQRYYCKPCRKYFQREYQYKACHHQISSRIMALTRESCGLRSISRLLSISLATVIRRIKTTGRSIKRTFASVKAKEYEVDEMRTYVGSKKRPCWIVYAIQKDNGRVVDLAVGKRNSKTLRKVIDTLLLADAKRIYTDGYDLYRHLIPTTIHRRSKYRINHIERKNLSLRTHLKRL